MDGAIQICTPYWKQTTQSTARNPPPNRLPNPSTEPAGRNSPQLMRSWSVTAVLPPAACDRGRRSPAGFGQDLLPALGPGQRLAARIVCVNEGTDGADEIGH